LICMGISLKYVTARCPYYLLPEPFPLSRSIQHDSTPHPTPLLTAQTSQPAYASLAGDERLVTTTPSCIEG
jgi:hypothetical protein